MTTACSCIINHVPQPTTVSVPTQTVVVTATKTAACTDSTPLVKNGAFDTKQLAPWTAGFWSGSRDWAALGESDKVYWNVSTTNSPTNYSFVGTDNKVPPYNGDVDMYVAQNVTLCPGREYRISWSWFITDYGGTGRKEQSLLVWLNDGAIAGTTIYDIQGPFPNITWFSGSTGFIAKTSTTFIGFRYKADYKRTRAAQWGIDNVVIEPWARSTV